MTITEMAARSNRWKGVPLQRAWFPQVASGAAARERWAPAVAQPFPSLLMPIQLPFGHAKFPGPSDFAIDKPSAATGYDLDYTWHDEVCRSSDDHLRGPSEFELDLGKVADTLSRDYPAFFEHRPEYGIYHDDIKFSLGTDIESLLVGGKDTADDRTVINGKTAYKGSMETLRSVARKLCSDSKVKYRLGNAEHYGHHLRVNWECEGLIVKAVPFNIVAISLYSIARQGPSIKDQSEIGGFQLTHKVHRHVISLKEVHPPSLRNVLVSCLRLRQPEPALACAEASL